MAQKTVKSGASKTVNKKAITAKRENKPAEIAIEFKDVVKVYKTKHSTEKVLDKLNLSITKGNITSLVGLSGSGKTTILNTINRLIDINEGNIYLNGKSIYDLSLFKLRSNIAYVMQSSGLFAHLTIKQNLNLVRKVQLKRNILLLKEQYDSLYEGKSKDELKALKLELKEKIKKEKEEGQYSIENFNTKTIEYFKAVRLKLEHLNKRPMMISGGQRQRAGIVRALLENSDIILMDEPFSALDPIVRLKMQQLVLEIKKKYKKTIIMVTHDADEALHLSDEIVFLSKGEIIVSGNSEKILKTKDKLVQEFFLKKVKDEEE